MNGIPSIFDTPGPVPQEPSVPKPNESKQLKKKKTSPATKQQMINQLLQEHRRELEEPATKKSKKKDTSSTKTNKSSEKKNTSNKKKQGGLKIKLQETRKHKQKLRKSLEALNSSRTAKKPSDSLLETSFNSSSLNNNSNQTTPAKKKSKAAKGSNKSRILPLPFEVTPSKVVKKEPQTPVAQSSTKEPTNSDSVDVGREKLAWVIQPISVDDFMTQYWEKKPLLVQRKNPSYYSALLSRSKIDDMLRKHNIEYTKNIDITSYREGERETHNPDGRVLPPDMWSFYEEGCSIRMLNPKLTCLEFMR